MRAGLWIFAVMVLTSCANSSSNRVVDALETKAKAGDAVAACQLVLHDLRQCAERWEQWRPSTPGRRPPSCLDDAVPQEHERYLAESVGWVEGAPAPTLGSQTSRATRVIEVMMRLSPTDAQMFGDVVEMLDAIEETCPRLAGGG
jgi:hypothetical protein